jgi:hypothetical protein
MDTRNTSEGDRERRSQQRAMSLAEFCRDYGTGRTTAYREIKMGRLRVRKCGKRTLVLQDDAEAWLRSLPTVAAAGAKP